MSFFEGFRRGFGGDAPKGAILVGRVIGRLVSGLAIGAGITLSLYLAGIEIVYVSF